MAGHADGDGFGDSGDAFPLDPNEHADSDSDGVVTMPIRFINNDG
jgi:hypothetical protein